MHRLTTVCGLAVAAVLAAGCASSPGVADPGAPSNPSNRQRADAEAQYLLSLARLPPHAIELSAQPSSEPGPVMGVPRTSSLIDRARYWKVSMPFTDALAWVAAHPPAGLSDGGSANGSSPLFSGVSYIAPDTDAWTGAQLEVMVAADGVDASDIRADGVVLWLDPVPRRDTAAGNRLAVTASGDCPQSDRGYSGVRNTGAGLAKALLPAGEPTGGLVCVYDGMNGTRFGLIAQHELDASAATRLASAAVRVPLSHVDNEVVNCPMDDGAAAVLVFSYRNGSDAALWYRRNGCQGLSNGEITAAPDQQFIDAFRPFIAADPPAATH